MTSRIIDSDALLSISPENLAAYLAQREWQESGDWRGKATIWEYGNTEVLIPNSISYRDYAARINQALSILAQVEQRAISEVYSSIRETLNDILRVRAMHPDASDGSIPLVDGVALFQATYDMLLSAATVVDKKRALLPNRKPNDALEYVNKLARIGQTEHGSYVVVVHSKVDANPLESLDETDIPFGRKVLRTLADTLISIQGISERVDPEDSGEAVLENEAVSFVDAGGSAEMCKAIESLNAGAKEQNVEIGFSWSTGFPAPSMASNSILITPRVAALTERLGKTVQRQWASVRKTITGTINAIGRDDKGGVAVVTIVGEIDGVKRHVRVRLMSEDEHTAAVDAYHRKKTVTCRGMLVKSGSHNRFDNYDNFKVIEE